MSKRNIRFVFSGKSNDSDKPIRKKIKKSKRIIINDVILPDCTLISFMKDLDKSIKKDIYGKYLNTTTQEWNSFIDDIEKNIGLNGILILKNLINNYQFRYNIKFKLFIDYTPLFIKKYYENIIHYGMNDIVSIIRTSI